MTLLVKNEDVKTVLDNLTAKLKGPKPTFNEWTRDSEKLTTTKFYLFREEFAKALGVKLIVTKSDSYPYTSIDIELNGFDVRLSAKNGRASVHLHKTYSDNGNPWYDAKSELERTDKSIKLDLTADMNRGAEAVARDVVRKLLPSAEKVAEKAVELIAKKKNAINRLDAFVARFLKEVPGSTVRDHGGSTYEKNVHLKGLFYEVRLSIYEDGIENINFQTGSVPANAAIKFFNEVAKKKGK